MTSKIICIHSNDTEISKQTKKELLAKLINAGYTVEDELSEETELLICIGGDGVILDALHRFNFPRVPVIGVNTGHLGFFQEVESHTLDAFIKNYREGRYRLQPLSTVEGIVTFTNGSTIVINALNEIVIRGNNYLASHLELSIDGSFIEKFSGDGLLVATSAGSTAYNYSLGGSIVDPRLDLLQVTPLAPMNTTAYRSFTSSILLPPDLHLDVVPDLTRCEKISIVADGECSVLSNVANIKVGVSDIEVNLLRFETYDFWNKVKTKFL